MLRSALLQHVGGYLVNQVLKSILSDPDNSVYNIQNNPRLFISKPAQSVSEGSEDILVLTQGEAEAVLRLRSRI